LKDVNEIAEIAGRAALAKGGSDVLLIDIRGLASFADFFVNVTARNTRMLDTILTEIDAKLTPEGLTSERQEGRADSGWVLADYGDIIVNVFLEEQRNTYRLEKIWADGAFTELEEN
jgi:ribosome-associated protein